MKLLTRKEERTLLASYQAGDRQAADTLLTHFKDFITGRVNDQLAAGPRQNFDDAYQEASIAFDYAMRSFDLTRKTGLCAYARPRIAGALKNHWESGRSILQGVTTSDAGRAVIRNPNDVDRDDTKQALLEAYVLSPAGNMPVEWCGDDAPNPEELVGNAEREELLSRLLADFASDLDPLDRHIFDWRMLQDTGDQHSLQLIADAHGVSAPTILRRERYIRVLLADFLSPYRGDLLENS